MPMAHIVDDLRLIVGPDAVLTDEDSLTFFSQDVYRAGVKPLAIVRPSTVDALAQVVRTGLLYEPVFYWEDSHSTFHRKETPPEMLATMRSFPDNPEGRAVVQQVRDAMVELMYAHGAVHLQIGKAYPYVRERDGAFMGLLSAIKSQIDPQGLINPGALGLSGSGS
jgi:FAD/FMN-containing dehydrogenase